MRSAICLSFNNKEYTGINSERRKGLPTPNPKTQDPNPN